MERFHFLESAEQLLVPIVRPIAARLSPHTLDLVIVAIGTPQRPKIIVAYIPSEERARQTIECIIDNMVHDQFFCAPYRGVTFLRALHQKTQIPVTFFPAATMNEIATFIEMMTSQIEESPMRVDLN